VVVEGVEGMGRSAAVAAVGCGAPGAGRTEVRAKSSYQSFTVAD